MELAAQRRRLRQEILARRDGLSPAERAAKSRRICETLWQLEPVTTAECIMVYLHFRSEVETGWLVERCLAEGRRLTAPLTDPGRRRLLPYALHDPSRELRPGFCGIPEPDPALTEAVAPAEIDLVVVPGSVFDPAGGRLGYGGGYYDRFLALDAPGALRVGVAFDLQVVERLPLLAHDQPLDWLITESRRYHPEGR